MAGIVALNGKACYKDTGILVMINCLEIGFIAWMPYAKLAGRVRCVRREQVMSSLGSMDSHCSAGWVSDTSSSEGMVGPGAARMRGATSFCTRPTA